MTEWERLSKEAQRFYPDVVDVPLFKKAGEHFTKAVEQAEECNITGTIKSVGHCGDSIGQLMDGIRKNEIPVAKGKELENDMNLLHLLDDIIRGDLPLTIKDALTRKCSCKGK